jgi:hypothetical protein
VVETIAERTSDAQVTLVGLDVSKLSGVVPEALTCCFKLVADGTPLHAARLEISEVRVTTLVSTTISLTSRAPASTDITITNRVPLLARSPSGRTCSRRTTGWRSAIGRGWPRVGRSPSIP